MASDKVHSLEAAMEQERREIEALLMQQSNRGPASTHSARSPSPYRTPRSPVRSMLDVSTGPSGNGSRSPGPHQPTFRSMLDVDTPPPPPAPIRSMLDVDSPPASTGRSLHHSHSAQTSPTVSTHKTSSPPSIHPRSMSDAASKPADFGPRSPPLPRDRNFDPTAAYQFSDIYATNVGQAGPGSSKSQTGSKGQSSSKRSLFGSSSSRPSAIGEALRGSDMSGIVLPGDHRSRSMGGRRSSSKSKSPSNRFALRSESPRGSLFGGAPGRQSIGNVVLDSTGQPIDMNSAYRRLSDANLLYGGSTTLASYARKKSEGDGIGRIEKDNMSPYGEILPSDESDDDGLRSSDEENDRGRQLTKRADLDAGDADGEPGKEHKSLLASIEGERSRIAAQSNYRSLLEPEITVTAPAGAKKSKNAVQPATSFDQDPPSGIHTPQEANAEVMLNDVSAIKAAQNLQLTTTGIISHPEAHRSVRILYRGAFQRIQKELEEEHRRSRKYLVAMDLSDESTHALEWAVGTILRDGDTLIGIYCMDEEATGNTDPAGQVPDDPKSMREQAAALSAMTRSSGNSSPFGIHRPSLAPRMRSDGGSNASSPAPSMRNMTKLDEERMHAVNDITERASRLLRKTELQVRVIVECIHCKNPKHLITEVIDLINPTLVILGSRGRSALKGTLLGSFSNYLVTKSSVPVMVARKRLRKKSKYQAPPMKQVNNLANPSARSLETARID